MNIRTLDSVAVAPRPPAARHTEHGRTTFIDNLRVAMTALVVVQHAALTYGAKGPWYWREAPEGSDLGLTLFCVLNQTFAMGVFFLIAGYFTPASVDRKGPARFMADRLLRLGLPLVIFGFVLNSLTVALAQGHSVREILSVWTHLMARGAFGAGPLWFAEMLLALSAIYLLWRRVARRNDQTVRLLPGHAAILISAMVVGFGAFALRLCFPVGQTTAGLMVGFFSSYVALFAIGTIAARGKWLERVPLRLARPWLVVSAFALVPLVVLALTTTATGYAGGWSIKATFYAFFEPFFAWGVILGLLWLFRLHLNTPASWTSFLSARAYGVYVVHPPVLVIVARALSHWAAPVLLKASVAGALGCAASVAVASLILLVPGARRVF